MKDVRSNIQRIAHALADFGVAGPSVIGLSMLGIDGFELTTPAGARGFRSYVADRDDLVLPDVWVESIEQLSPIDDIAKPVLDMLWQSFGAHGCVGYDENGAWRPSS
jgi:hypothetical protein